jgi:hypothetical protein
MTPRRVDGRHRFEASARRAGAGPLSSTASVGRPPGAGLSLLLGRVVQELASAMATLGCTAVGREVGLGWSCSRQSALESTDGA